MVTLGGDSDAAIRGVWNTDGYVSILCGEDTAERGGLAAKAIGQMEALRTGYDAGTPNSGGGGYAPHPRVRYLCTCHCVYN